MGHGTDVAVAGLSVHPLLHRFVADELVPGIGMEADAVWTGFAVIVHDLAPRTRELLAERARLQAEIDEWHRAHPGAGDQAEYQTFLEDIGYLVPEGAAFSITTAGVDPEVSGIAGPQLVVPVSNARYALNAANARWGSLYDAVYGTDVLGSPPPPGPYDTERGAQVIVWVRRFLDDVVPLRTGSHADVGAYRILDGALVADDVPLADPSCLVGWQGSPDAPTAVLVRHHGLHIELRVDREHPVGRTDRAGVSDVVLEAAVTAIMDCEDSVAAVDAADKVAIYRNWLGLMRGDLMAEVPGADGSVRQRRLAPDRSFTTSSGTIELPGRALLLVRNVGHLMTTDAVRDRDGCEVPEGFLDALVTVLAAVHDLHGPEPSSSRAGSIYVVKPKLHGPAEVALADELFARVEALCGLAPNTVKLGLMDEERRTSANLLECIRAVASRIVFINTGFLDRTGDEIHTSMEAGVMVPKADMKHQPWLGAYEARNVATGLACGFRGRAQIGKGMWAAPDRMGAMVAEKIAHPNAGATCAWVPSPTAATLHATHYHRVDVGARQDALTNQPVPDLGALLTIPIADPGALTVEQRRREVEGNAQSILGYVVRWVDQGIGCSKVPDIDDVALMEDRATCRISSQHIANWLRHGVVSADDVTDAMRRMAVVVDRQNEADPAYRPMAPTYDGPAFRAACQLVLAGAEQPSGYTEPILHAHRRELTAGEEAAWTA